MSLHVITMPDGKMRRRSTNESDLKWTLYHPLSITPLQCSRTDWYGEQCPNTGTYYFYDTSAPVCHEPKTLAYGLITTCKDHFHLFLEDQKDSLRECTIDLIDENEFLVEAVMTG
jgi:hypothetical protein